MGNYSSKRGGRAPDIGKESQVDDRRASHSQPPLLAGVLPSLYQRRVQLLAVEALESPPTLPVEETLRDAIDFCYGGGRDWAPHVRVTVYADNPVEHQSNVPVYSTLLCTWGVPGFEKEEVRCKPVEGTDVRSGRVTVSAFWSRRVLVRGRPVLYRGLIHQLLHRFLILPDGDKRRQLLVNIILQLHEACYNCIGRHKEVFEYCIYDLIEAEAGEEPWPDAKQLAGYIGGDTAAPAAPVADPMESARATVRRHAAMFLDKHKRNALGAACLSPLKFLFQRCYEVFENIDSHGASFWASMLTIAFFPGLEMPFESIVELDTGWTWGAVHFLEQMRDGDARVALERFSAPENIGQDWRSLSVGLRPPRASRQRLPGLPFAFGEEGFRTALAEAKRPKSKLRLALRPYAERFARMMARDVLLHHCTLAAVSSVTWDAMLGPALSALSEDALGSPVSAEDLRVALCGDVSDAAAIEVDTSSFERLLRAAGVPWAEL